MKIKSITRQLLMLLMLVFLFTGIPVTSILANNEVDEQFVEDNKANPEISVSFNGINAPHLRGIYAKAADNETISSIRTDKRGVTVYAEMEEGYTLENINGGKNDCSVRVAGKTNGRLEVRVIVSNQSGDKTIILKEKTIDTYNLTIDADENVLDIDVTGGEKQPDGTYRVTDECSFTLSFKCKEDFGVREFLLDDEPDSLTRSMGAYEYSYRLSRNLTIVIRTQEQYSLNVHKLNNISFKLFHIVEDEGEIRYEEIWDDLDGFVVNRDEQLEIATEYSVGIFGEYYIGLYDPEMDDPTATPNFVFSGNDSFTEGDIEGVTPVDADTFNSIYECSGEIRAAYKVNLTKTTPIYIGRKPRSVNYDVSGDVNVDFVNKNTEAGTPIYRLSSDGKHVEIYNDGPISFKLNKSGYKVVGYYYDGAETTQMQVPYYPDEDGVYSVQSSCDYGSLLNLKIFVEKRVKIKFETQNTTVKLVDNDNSINEIDVDAGTPVGFEVVANDDYEIFDVTTSGKEENFLLTEYISEGRRIYSVIADDDITIKAVSEKRAKELVVASDLPELNIEFASDDIKKNPEHRYDQFSDYYRVFNSPNVIEFSIVSSSNVQPFAALVNEDGVRETASLISKKNADKAKNTWKYDFSIYSDIMTEEGNRLYISNNSELSNQKLVVSTTTNAINTVVVADENGGIIEESNLDSRDGFVKVYDVEMTKKYTVTITANDGYSAGRVYVKYADSYEESKRYSEQTAVFDVDIFMDTNISVTPEIGRQIKVYSEKLDASGMLTGTPDLDSVVDPTVGTSVYSLGLLNSNSYIVEITEGVNNTPSVISAFKGRLSTIKALPSGGAPEGKFRIIAGDQGSIPDVKDKIPTIYVNQLKTGVLSLIYADNTVGRMQLTVTTEMSNYSISGKNVKIATIGQRNPSDTFTAEIDRRGAFVLAALESNGTEYKGNASFEHIKFVVETEGGNTYTDASGNEAYCVEVVPYSVNKNRMRFFALTGDVPNKNATVSVVDTRNGNKYLSFKVNINDSNNKSINPQVEIKDNDDVSVTFNFRNNSSIHSAYRGKVYYRIIPEVKGTIPEEVKNYINNTPYYAPVTWPEYPEDATEKQIEQIEQNFVQRVKVPVIKLESGKGAKIDFNFKIDLVQTKIGITDATIADGNYFTGASTVNLEGGTAEPVFETNLSLKKASSSVTTGQKNVKIATAVFSKGTSCKGLELADVTEGLSDKTKLKLSIGEEVADIVASSDAFTAVGKHTIEVKPIVPATMYAKSATLVVDVSRGITALQISTDTSSIFKKDNAIASVDTKVIFNNGGEQPSSKKVTYELIDSDENIIKAVKDSNESSTYDGYIRMQGSKIIIEKDISVPDEGITFKVRVKAADVENSKVSAESKPITISKTRLEIGKIKLVVRDRANGVYKVLADSDKNSELLVSDLNNAYVVAFKKNAQDKDLYTNQELEEAVLNISNYSVNSANKAFAIVKDGDFYKLTCEKVIKNVKIAAKALDGGNSSNTITVSTKYFEPKILAAKFSYESGDELVLNNEKYEFEGNSNTRISVRVGHMEDGKYNTLPSLANYTVTIKGGKIISTDTNSATVGIVVTGASAQITITNKALTKRDEHYTVTYTVVNKNYSSVAAPKITVSQAPKSGKAISQNSILKIKPNKNYDVTDKYVVLAIDSTTIAKAKQNIVDNYMILASACDAIGSSEPIKIEKNSIDNTYEAKLKFENIQLQDGSYKLAAVFGRMDNNKFIPETKVSAVTIKVAKPKVNRGTIKFQAKYQLNNDMAELTYTGKEIQSISSVSVMNCNIAGKQNSFNEYFTVELNGNGKIVAKLKSDLSADKLNYIKSQAGANDRIAYLILDLKMGDDGFGSPIDTKIVSKITLY